MSTAKFNVWQNPDGTENYKCRAWVNFNGTGTVAIRAAGNVSSITDNGAGNYTVNFTTVMPDANYAAVPQNGRAGATAISSTSDRWTTKTGEQTVNGVRVFVVTPAGTADTTVGGIDADQISVAIFR